MKTNNRLLISLVALTVTLASVTTSQAVVVIYKVSFNAKARFFSKNLPNGNSFKHRGYLVYDTANPGASFTVELVPKTKTYRIQSTMINNIAPSSIGFFVLDRNTDAFSETQGGLISGTGISRSYLGKISRKGIRFGNSVPLTGLAKTLRGEGSVTGQSDYFKTSDVWKMDKLTAAGPVNTNAGLNLVTAFLAGKNYVQVP